MLASHSIDKRMLRSGITGRLRLPTMRAAWLGQSRAARNAIAAGMLALLGVWAVGGFFIWFVGHTARSEALASAQNTSVMVSAYVSQTLKAGGIVIDSMRSMIADHNIADEAEFRRFVAQQSVHATLRDRIANMREINYTAFIGRDGAVLNFSMRYPPPVINVADRDYFRAQMAKGAPDVSLSTAVVDRGSGKQTFYLAKRITSPSGAVLGLAIAGIDAGFVSSFFAKTALGAASAIMLTRNDGLLLTGEGVADGAFGKPAGTGADTGSSGPARFVDGPTNVPIRFKPSSYVVATRDVDGATARVTVLIGDDEIYANWWNWTSVILALCLLQSLFRGIALARVLGLIGTLASMHNGAQAASDAKSQGVAHISHELRSPLNNIIGMLAGIKGKALDDETRHAIEMAERSAGHLLAIVDDLLDLSKIEAGRLAIDISRCSISDMVQNLIGTMTQAASGRGNQLHYHLSADLPRCLETDEARVRQVLLNILGNAVKFTENGRIDLTVTASPIDDGKVLLRFSVTDTGIGIAPAVQDKLFNDFIQAGPSIRRRFGGSGLGLSISRRLLELLGGRISLQSELGRGSVFTFELPCKIAEPDPVAAPQPEYLGPIQGLNLLVVEDSVTNQMVIRQYLQRDHHVCDFATNGLEGWMAAQSKHYDAILMDVHMPEMDGVDATRKIRELPGMAGQVPVIMVTAHAMAGNREEYLAVGADDFVSKPIKHELLRAALSRAMSKPTRTET